MRAIHILILAGVIMVCGCASVKSEKDIAVRDLLRNSYWFTTTNGCRVAHDEMLDNATYEWSGSCQSGKVTGCGRLVKRDGNDNIERMNGCFVDGLKNGRFTATNSLQPGTIYYIGYSMGSVTDFDDKPPSPSPPIRQLSDDPKTTGRGARGG